MMICGNSNGMTGKKALIRRDGQDAVIAEIVNAHRRNHPDAPFVVLKDREDILVA